MSNPVCLVWENSTEKTNTVSEDLGSRDRARILRPLRAGKFILENGNKVPKFVRKTVKQELL